jgi:hypothetical protein
MMPRMSARLVLALLVSFGGLACGASTEEPRNAPREEVEASPAPGIALTIDLRGRRIDVSPDGALHAEGCDAARYDWEARALVDTHGEQMFEASLEGAARSITAPDGNVVMTVGDREVLGGETVLLRIEDDGTLTDAAPGAVPASASIPIPEARREQVLSLLGLVAMCWETHPRDIPEP